MTGADPRPTVLIVDDEPRLCRSLEILLKEEGPFRALVATDYYQALEKMKEPVDLVLTDLTMPGKSGLELLRAVKKDFPSVPIILMTAYSTVASAVEAMKDGAADYVVKPFDNDKLVALIRRTLRVAERLPARAEIPEEAERFGDLLGKSPLMQEVYERIRRAAGTDSTVLITGESGTGKELVAKAIHFSGGRKGKPFVALNCTAVPESLLESELFGHERGAFTGAVRQQDGRFELADHGTLFLDEIGDMAPALQVKLLRVLAEKEFVRIGGKGTIRVDVRIIAATNRDLPRTVADGKFREDLFYRLNVIVIDCPPLRNRREDMPILLDHFLSEKSRKNGLAPKTLSEDARTLLMEYAFPGNVRELENLIERAVVMSRRDVLEPADFPIRAPGMPVGPDSFTLPVEEGIRKLGEIQATLERDVIERALRRHPEKSNTELAKLLGTSRRILEIRLKLYRLKKD